MPDGTSSPPSGAEPAPKKPEELLGELRTDPAKGLTAAEAASRLSQYGPNELEEKKDSPLKRLLGYFWGPLPWMVEAPAVMALIIRDWVDFAIIMFMLVFNALLGFWEESAAGNALASLKSSLALKARALRDAIWGEIPARELVPGDIVRVRLGDVIPADGTLLDGAFLSVDQSALTGESLAVSKQRGDTVYSGSAVKQGEMTMVVTATGAATYLGRTARLVAGAGARSHFQRAIVNIGNFLIVLTLTLAMILVIDQLAKMDGHFSHTALFGLAEYVLVLLVAAVPFTTPAVLSVTMALGAKMLAAKKAIVSKLESIEELAGMDILCSDKTGTLTQNKLTLGDVIPAAPATAADVILAGSLASKPEDGDAIDQAVISGLADASALRAYRLENFVPFDPVSKRTEATLTDARGRQIKASKGMPAVIMDLCALPPGQREPIERQVNDLASRGLRALAAARADEGGPWQFLGLLPLMDPPRPDSKQTIAEARNLGIGVKMVTGDDVAIARTIAGELGLGTKIQLASDLFPEEAGKEGEMPAGAAQKIAAADGYARVFPQHKYGA
ncbi:MAG: plasma-membrane proton-efflux P-type ATPase, partial [Terrimicrobiaceae bacterium]|nr:plasma-membrane proton-efflux P-type ATPase [Terrimicrobiaceae bacterium]